MQSFRRISTSADASKLLQGVDYVLLDVDGVLLAGPHMLPDVDIAIREFRRLGKRLRVVTNNSTKPIPKLLGHFKQLGLTFADDELMTSSTATAEFLRNHPSKPLQRGNLFVVGSPGLVGDLQKVVPAGRALYGPQLAPESKHPFGEIIRTMDFNRVAASVYEKLLPPIVEGGENESVDSLNVSCVVVALDPSFSMTKLAMANLFLRHKRPEGEKCLFVATNADPQIGIGHLNPSTGDKETALLPGGGTLVNAISAAVGFRPTEVGKPHRHMFDAIFHREKALGKIADDEDETAFARRCLMVGDRLTTDIAFGKGVGARTLLVETGCEGEADVGRTGIVPDAMATGLGAVGKLLTGVGGGGGSSKL